MATYRIDGVKYNPANWADLDPSERAACNRFAAARERELNTITATQWLCHGGPFAGSTIEPESTTEHSAALTVGQWCGRYELSADPNNRNAKRLQWVGNDAGAPVNTHGTSSASKAASDVTARGFDQLRDLLAELAEDPAERAISSPQGPRARYTIGRTTYTIAATSEAAQRLRARIVKAKRWFADKLLPSTEADQRQQPDDTTPDAPAIIAASLAIGAAQASAAASAAPVPSLFGGAPSGNSHALETLDGFKAGDTVEVDPNARTIGRGTIELLHTRNISGMECKLARIIRADGRRFDVQTFDLRHIDTNREACELATVDAPDDTDNASATPATHTPTESADAIGTTDTPSASDANDYTDPLKTRAQASDYTNPLKTQTTGNAEASNSTSSAAAPTAAQFLADIPQDFARNAFNGTSFSPERRGDSRRNEYAESLAEDYAHFLQHAQKGGTLDKLPAEFARYRARLAGLMRAYLASQSRCVSSFIVGPANFPAARMNKRADIAHRRLGEYLDTRETARRAVVRNLRPDLRPIMAGDADAADRLAAELASAERLQEAMKQANAAIRKHAKAGEAQQLAALLELGFTEQAAIELLHPKFSYQGLGFPFYRLTNNSANIRRMRQRLEQIERNKAADVTEATGADGVRMEDDPPANRVRLYFPDKPAADVREGLKRDGFRWAPTIGAWQAYRNHWTLQKARELAGTTAADQAPAGDTPDTSEQAAAADTPSTETPRNDSAPVETLSQADDCTEAVETQNTEPKPDPSAALRRAYTWHKTNESDPLGQPAGHRHQAQQGQRINSKGGNWRAAFYRIGDRLHMAIRSRDGFETVPGFDTTTDHVRALQFIGATLDAADGRLAAISTATSAPNFRALDQYPENLEGEALAQWFSIATSSQDAAEYWQDALDHINGGRIVATRNALRIWGWEADTAAWPMTFRDRVGLRLDVWHVGAGHNVARVTWTASNGVAIVDDLSMSPELLASHIHAAAHPGDTQPPREDGTPSNDTQESAADRTTPPEIQQDTTAPAFQRAKPEHVDLRAFIAAGIEPAQLVGVGVVYTGDASNAGGQGAIVSATACESRGVRVAVTLEDGRHMDHLDAYSFADRPGSRFAINAKVHGAPYLAELAAARAAKVASDEAAKTSKEQHHAAELVRLAAEFPHLQRQGPNDRGGVFAARNIRTMLKSEFPGVKFSVTSDYNSVRVRWTDGPTNEQVKTTIGRFDIGRADYDTDYFYTTSSAWSDLFGGVQYLFTDRDESPELVARALEAFNSRYSTQATPEDWRTQSGPFSYAAKDCNAYRHWFRELLNKTDATPPAKAARKGSKA